MAREVSYQATATCARPYVVLARGGKNIHIPLYPSLSQPSLSWLQFLYKKQNEAYMISSMISFNQENLIDLQPLHYVPLRFRKPGRPLSEACSANF